MTTDHYNLSGEQIDRQEIRGDGIQGPVESGGTLIFTRCLKKEKLRRKLEVFQPKISDVLLVSLVDFCFVFICKNCVFITAIPNKQK